MQEDIGPSPATHEHIAVYGLGMSTKKQVLSQLAWKKKYCPLATIMTNSLRKRPPPSIEKK